MNKYSLAIDQGTTSCRSIIFDTKSNVISKHQLEFNQIYPKPGWVEHDANEILKTQVNCIVSTISKAGIKPNEIISVGITNQRETCLIWDIETGKPIYNAIVWQCRRTSDHISKLQSKHAFITSKTGLIPDAYFSASKIAWLLENVPNAYESAKLGKLVFGTIDTWLIYNLTIAKNHFTEPSNASRTMLYNIINLDWDDELFELFNIPIVMAPKLLASNGNFGETNPEILGFKAPICSVLGDQQASLFGQNCLGIGEVKCTYGTGSFVLINTQDKIIKNPGLLTSIAWKLSDKKPCYAIEGSNFIAGALIKWLIDELKILSDAKKSCDLALSVADNGGVYIIPALAGLGAPWWRQDIRGIIYGLTRGTKSAHIIRASLEAIAFQVNDILNTLNYNDIKISNMSVDGGVSNNDFLLQFQADLANINVHRSNHIESTAWGVSALSLITVNEIKSLQEYKSINKPTKFFSPQENQQKNYSKWKFLIENFLKINFQAMLD